MQAELVIAVIEALEAESIPYFLAGSIASMVYGIPLPNWQSGAICSLRAHP